MSRKKKNKVDVCHISSVENTLRQMPRYNAFQGGYGVWDKNGKHPKRHQTKAKDRKTFRNYM